jgi:sigma-B regulation protein RsbU (phosphoserine phosphatase)
MKRTSSSQPPRAASDTELLSTLFELGREVTSVLDLADLLEKIPQLIARLTQFSAFSVYLLDEQRQSSHRVRRSAIRRRSSERCG